jgi:tetratricopeptide (TPR) repeat protein
MNNNKETLFLEALEKTTTGDITLAKEMTESLLIESPDFGKAHYLMGWILFESMNDLEKAKNHAKLAMKYAPENPLGYYLYCDILMADQNLEEIKAVTEGIGNLNLEDKGYIYHKLACAYELRRQYHNAIDSLRKAKGLSTTLSWDSFVDIEISRVKRKIAVL